MFSRKRSKFDIIGTEVIHEDIFQDRFEVSPAAIKHIPKSSLPELWMANPDIYEILQQAADLEHAREDLYIYLGRCEDRVFAVDNDYHILEKATIRECVRVFKSIIGPINEMRTGTSALKYLFELSRGGHPDDYPELQHDFIFEFIHLFRGVAGLSGIYSASGKPELRSVPDFISKDGREAALSRSDFLDELAEKAEKRLAQYKTGLDESVIKSREKNVERICQELSASPENWQDYRWHLKHVVKTAGELAKFVDLSEDEQKAIQIAEKFGIPFGVTPYYTSLMDKKPRHQEDHAVRAQVIPPMQYARFFAEHRAERGMIMDFMGEHDTSPVDLITRRYPEILIIKPYNSCSQICVYCQRNWEIEGVMDPKAVYPQSDIDRALDFIAEHKSIRDVLITGGDPLVLPDRKIKKICDRIAEMDHVFRIRVGSRMPVVLPFRITDDLCKLLASYVEVGRREVCLVTHFEHAYEVTPEAGEAVMKLRCKGISVYNQQVFTFENSRRFETVALRRSLRKIGVDPYYTFITKGKEETDHYRVPLARILQERKEEARLFPGLDRTDEPVFNVPRLGKNHLRSWQDHRLIMILPDGRRVYEFHPWEKFVTPVPPYNYVDVSIYRYLERLKENGEDPSDYRSIWYYY